MAGEQDWLRGRLEELEQIDRPSASGGERRAAEWLVGQFAELDAEARIEAEPAHGTYWWPLGIRGEGFLKMREYPPRSLAFMDGLAEELGIWLYPNLRLRNGTDGMEPLAAGYETSVLAGCTDLKQPANYHWPDDLAANVDFDTVASGVGLTEAAIRRLGECWL